MLLVGPTLQSHLWGQFPWTAAWAGLHPPSVTINFNSEIKQLPWCKPLPFVQEKSLQPARLPTAWQKLSKTSSAAQGKCSTPTSDIFAAVFSLKKNITVQSILPLKHKLKWGSGSACCILSRIMQLNQDYITRVWLQKCGSHYTEPGYDYRVAAHHRLHICNEKLNLLLILPINISV